jgi:hypothetical protein
MCLSIIQPAPLLRRYAKEEQKRKRDAAEAARLFDEFAESFEEGGSGQHSSKIGGVGQTLLRCSFCATCSFWFCCSRRPVDHRPRPVWAT